MAVIKGFKGLRFADKAGDISTLICPPYDIIDNNMRAELINKNEYNLVRLELPEGENKYESAGKLYTKWLSDGILKQDEKDCIYIYKETFSVNGEQKSFKGIICNVRLEEFEKGVVLPHENTLSKAKTDRFNLMSATYANFSQIYSMYMDEEKVTSARIDKLSAVNADITALDADGIKHELWIIDDESEINELVSEFASRQLFIADGHHRYETALNFRNKLIEDGSFSTMPNAAYCMMFLVDMEDSGLVVFPTHRLVKNLPEFDEKKILNKLNSFYNIEKLGKTNIEDCLKAHADEHAAVWYTGKDYCYLLTVNDLTDVKKFNPDMSDYSCDLDVTVLHTLAMENCLSISKEDMANQTYISYTRSIDEAFSGVENGRYQCSFILNATKVSQIKDVAKAGEKMPQKSTYFYPKLITGLVMNKLN